VKTQYLLLKPGKSASGQYLYEIEHVAEWVDNPEDATEDSKEAAEAVQERLKESGIKTELAERPSKNQTQSQWIITRKV
jgi:hypothetical protein